MAAKYINIDRNSPMLLPVDLREWVAEDDMVHFVIEAVENANLSNFKINHRGSGSAQYPPRMLLSLLIYCYASGIFSSRRIELATYRDISVRYLAGNTHPDHDTICKFRRGNLDGLSAIFLYVLQLARQAGILKVGTVSVDGTHIKANASKYKNISYKRAGEIEDLLNEDIKELLEKAEQADRPEHTDGQQLPEELSSREKLRAKMRHARCELDRRAKQHAQAQKADYENRVKDRQYRENKGPRIKPPQDTPDGDKNINLTDSDSQIMCKSKRSGYEQAYNAQIAVDADGTQLILSNHVTNCPSDANELRPAVKNIPREIGKAEKLLADCGYSNSQAIEELESEGLDVYVSVGREENQAQRRYEYRVERNKEQKKLTNECLLDMRKKLQTEAGKIIYNKRKKTVEPVFGVIKHVLGFRQFLLRGIEKVSGEWKLVCLAYNVKRLFNLKSALNPV